MNGLVLERDETLRNPSTWALDPNAPAPLEYHYYFNGVRLGDVGNDGTSDVDYVTSMARHTTAQGTGPFRWGAATGTPHADFDQSYDPVNGLTYRSASGRYTVREGDTLQSIALAVWGDSSLWYKIAEANGLSAGAALAEGQGLTIPAGVSRSGHNANTVVASMIGSTVGRGVGIDSWLQERFSFKQVALAAIGGAGRRSDGAGRRIRQSRSVRQDRQ